MSLPAAVATGLVAAVAVPWAAAGRNDVLGGLFTGELMRVPIGQGFEMHWSWLVFCAVTLAAWALLRAARGK